MAGDWIKMRTNLWDDPRVGRMCDLIDTIDATVIGGLYWLWSTADQHSEDGFMPGMTLPLIDRKTRIPGFGNALVQVGWIHEEEDGICLTRFDEHNGKSAKRRCMEAQRKANSRSVSASDADSMRTESGHDADEMRRFAELEKRREEKKEIPSFADAKLPEEQPAAAPRVPSCPTEKIVNLYHEKLPVLSKVVAISDARKRSISARWREVCASDKLDLDAGLEFFGWFFEHVAHSDFLCGRAKDWKADIDFLFNAQKFAQIVEGKYHQRQNPNFRQSSNDPHLAANLTRVA